MEAGARADGGGALAKHEQAITDELDRRREVIGYYLEANRSIRDTFTQFFSGGGFNFKNIEQSFKKLNGQVITEQLFGGMFRDLDTWLKGQSGLSPSVDYLAGESQRAANGWVVLPMHSIGPLPR